CRSILSESTIVPDRRDTFPPGAGRTCLDAPEGPGDQRRRHVWRTTGSTTSARSDDRPILTQKRCCWKLEVASPSRPSRTSAGRARRRGIPGTGAMALPISKWPAGSFGWFQCNPGCLLLPLGRKAARAHGLRAPSPIPDRLFPMARAALLLLGFTMPLGLVAEAAAPGLGSTTMVAGAVGMIAIGRGGITWLRLRPLIISWWQFRR